MLNTFVITTGYERKHATKLLNGKNQRAVTPNKRGNAARYGEEVVKVLELLWHASNRICSKRLVPFIPELLAILERRGHLCISDALRTQVLSVSAATFDRLLQPIRRHSGVGISTTQTGTQLKNQIRVRTFADWNEQKPGFFECDLVAHCGDTAMGTFLNTLVMTDIVTTWTECIGLIKKSADDVILGFDTASQLLPYPILGLDVDNVLTLESSNFYNKIISCH